MVCFASAFVKRAIFFRIEQLQRSIDRIGKLPRMKFFQTEQSIEVNQLPFNAEPSDDLTTSFGGKCQPQRWTCLDVQFMKSERFRFTQLSRQFDGTCICRKLEKCAIRDGPSGRQPVIEWEIINKIVVAARICVHFMLRQRLQPAQQTIHIRKTHNFTISSNIAKVIITCCWVENPWLDCKSRCQISYFERDDVAPIDIFSTHIKVTDQIAKWKFAFRSIYDHKCS